MSQPYVSLVLICGESGLKTLGKAIASVTSRGLVDEVVIGFNGKSRAQIPSESHGIPINVHQKEWKKDFADARNHAHSHAKGKWHLRMDSDDVLARADHPEIRKKAQQVNLNIDPGMSIGSAEGFRAELRELERTGVTCVMAPYYYAVDPQDRPLIEHVNRRLVLWSSGWEWHRRIHEDLRPTGNNVEKAPYNPTLLFIQYQDGAEPRVERNQEIHDEYVRELASLGEQASYRDWYNAGAMALDAGRVPAAVEELSRAVAGAAGDHVFLLAAREMLMRAQIAKGDLDAARKLAFDIIEADPGSRHGLLALSACYYHQKDWKKCFEWFQMGVAKPQSLQFAPDHHLMRWVWPAAWAADALSQTHQHVEAEKLISSVFADCNWDALVQQIRNGILERKEIASVEASVDRLIGYWTPRDAARAAELPKFRPQTLVEESSKYSVKRRGEKRQITIYAPQHVEAWEPHWIQSCGTGGSEEAIVYFAAELALRGYEVNVYSPVPTETQFRAVRYFPLKQFDSAVKYNVLLAHRCSVPVAQSRTLYIWHHDHQAPYLDKVTAESVRHLFVSNWQMQQIGKQLGISQFKGSIMGNGVPEEECHGWESKTQPGQATMDVYTPPHVRHAHRAIYASQPTRGLEQLLDAWPEIRSRVPNAELRVFYGFKTVQALADRHPEMEEAVQRVGAKLELSIRANIGVKSFGRIAQTHLMEEFRAAGVWPYPCSYPEVSCIAGLRAQAAGCIPVYTDAGALSETQNILCPPTTNFTDDVVRAMCYPQIHDREALRQAVLARSSWSKVVDRFLADLEIAP